MYYVNGHGQRCTRNFHKRSRRKLLFRGWITLTLQASSDSFARSSAVLMEDRKEVLSFSSLFLCVLCFAVCFSGNSGNGIWKGAESESFLVVFFSYWMFNRVHDLNSVAYCAGLVYIFMSVSACLRIYLRFLNKH